MLEASIPHLIENSRHRGSRKHLHLLNNHKTGIKRRRHHYESLQDSADHTPIGSQTDKHLAHSDASSSENLSDFDSTDSSFGSNDHHSDIYEDDENSEIAFDSLSQRNDLVAVSQKDGSDVSKDSSLVPISYKTTRERINRTDQLYSARIHSHHVQLKWDVPEEADQPHMMYLGNPSNDIKQKLKAKKQDLAAVTIHNGFSEIFIECEPLMFCSPRGFDWIASKFDDPNLPKQLLRDFNEVYEQLKEGLHFLSVTSESPIEFDKDIVFAAFEAYFKSFTGCFVYSFQELDTIVFREFGEHLPFDGTQYDTPDDELIDPFNRDPAEFTPTKHSDATKNFDNSYRGSAITGLNGYAEKLTIAAVTALGTVLLCCDSNPSSPNLASYKLATKYVSTAKYYFEKYSTIGNCIVGIKGTVMLLFLFNGFLDFKPVVTLSAIGVRLAQEIGLHRKESYANVPIRESIYRVNTWWILYCTEKDVCMKLNRPSCLFDGDISTPLPLPFAFSKLSNSMYINKINVLASLVRLYRIWNRLKSDMLSPLSELTIKERLVKHVMYEREIEAWKSTLPVEFRPDSSSNTSLLGIQIHTNMSNLVFRHLVFYTHATYFYIICALYRHISIHPSWIYRFTSDAEDSQTNSANDTPMNSGMSADDKAKGSESANEPVSSKKPAGKTSKKGTSSAGDNENINLEYHDLSGFDVATVASLLNEAQESHTNGKLRRTFSKNGVKLSIRRIALENPRLLQADKICVAASRKTTEIMLRAYPWCFVSIWHLSFFGLNAFVSFFVSSVFSPLDNNTIDNLSYIWNLMEVYGQLYNNTQGYMVQASLRPMMSRMAESLTKYVEKKRKDANIKDYQVPEFVSAISGYVNKRNEPFHSDAKTSDLGNNKTGAGTQSQSNQDSAATPSSNQSLLSANQNSQQPADQFAGMSTDFNTPTSPEFAAQLYSQGTGSQLPSYIVQPTPDQNRNLPESLSPFLKPNFYASNNKLRKSSVIGASTPGSLFDASGMGMQAPSPSLTATTGMFSLNGSGQHISSVNKPGPHPQNSEPINSSNGSITAIDNSIDARPGEPVLDYMYPDFNMGLDPDLCNSLFFMPGPSWVSLDTLGPPNYQAENPFSNSKNEKEKSGV